MNNFQEPAAPLSQEIRITQSWMQTILPALIVGAIAWGGMSVRMNQVEDRAREDRKSFSDSVKELTAEVSGLRLELQREREQRLVDRALQRPDYQPPHVTFPRGSRFDK